MTSYKTITVTLVVALIIGAIVYLESQKSTPGSADIAGAEIVIPNLAASEKAQQYERARELVSPAGFLNTEPFTIESLIGEQVILLDIWTYSCINCQRTLPYITAWHEKYADQGLTIIGIHTPEFEFEKERENVAAAIERFGIEYPVVQDNDYGTWRAYNNRYWPRKYLIDIDGFVVYDHIGEGAYEETERRIQELLLERAERLEENKESIPVTKTVPEGVEAVDVTMPRSPEIYFGAWRNDRLGNGEQRTPGGWRFEEPDTIQKNVLYFDGPWNIHHEYAENAEAGARIIFRYEAEKVFMVARSEKGARMRILQDGRPIGNAAGEHVDETGVVQVQNDRLYRLVENPDGHGEHVLEIITEDPGLQAFTFTFG